MVDFALNSILGKRDNQEDYGVIRSSRSLSGVIAVIADGMGGQVAGEVASSNAVNGFVESFVSNNSKNLPLKLSVALDKANRSLAKSISKNPKLQGMGATIIAAHIEPSSINWVSVGDSILYLYREKKLTRLNDDHSMMPVLQDSVRRGEITHEEARIHPHRNALRSALTGDEIPIIDLREEPFRLRRDDVIVLATDGILTLSEPEISSILEHCKFQSAKFIADKLLEAVTRINKPRQDNTLVEVIKVPGRTRFGFKWTVIVILISIFVIATVLIFSWKNIKPSLPSFEAISKEETITPTTEGSKIMPIQVEPSLTGEKNEVPLVVHTQVGTTSEKSADSPISIKNNKLSSERKLLPINKPVRTDTSKVPSEMEVPVKSMTPSVKSSTSEVSTHSADLVKSTSSNVSNNSAFAITPSATVPQSNGERDEQSSDVKKQ